MKKLWPFLLLLTGCAHKSKSVLFSFVNENPVCTGDITAPCAESGTLVDITGDTVISDSVPVEAPGAVSTYNLTPLPKSGKHTYRLTFNGKDQQGEAATSPAASTTVTIP